MISIIHTWKNRINLHFIRKNIFIFPLGISFSFLLRKKKKYWVSKNVKWEKFVIWFSINNLPLVNVTLKKKAKKKIIESSMIQMKGCNGLPINSKWRQNFKIRQLRMKNWMFQYHVMCGEGAAFVDYHVSTKFLFLVKHGKNPFPIFIET